MKLRSHQSSNDQAIDAFIAHKQEFDALLRQLQHLSDEHFHAAPDKITWGDVGSLASHLALLRRIAADAGVSGAAAD